MRRTVALVIVCGLTITTASGCATNTVSSGTVNPFCVVVGPPPPELIPHSGAPPSWVDDYLAVYDIECDG